MAIPKELLATLNPPIPNAPLAVPNAPAGQLAPANQLVVQPRPTPTGGTKPVTGTATTVRPASLTGPTPTPAGMGTAARFASGLVKGGVVGALLTPNTMGDGTISGAIANFRASGMGEDELIAKFGAQSVADNPNFNIDQMTSSGPQMSRLGDEPMSFPAPTGPSSTPSVEALIAQVQPPEAGLMGSPGIPAPAVPTSTFDVNTRDSDAPDGTVTMPSGLADQAIQDSLTPNQPLRNVSDLVSSDRAAFAEQNLADFMGNRDTAESATEQFLDPQGRLRRRDKATGELTEQYTSYEKEAAAREQRAGESFGKARGPDSRDNETGISDADRRDMAKANQRGASAGDVARGQKVADRAGVDMSTGQPLDTEDTKTAYETKLEGLDVAQREANLTKTNAQIADIISTNSPDAEVSDYSASQIGQLQKVMSENNLEMDEGKLWDKTGWGRTEIKQGDPEYDMIMGTEVGRAMLGKGAPKVGTVKGKYKFKGGDPSDQNNWELV